MPAPAISAKPWSRPKTLLSRDPDNLDARRLLGRIYLRSVGIMQGGAAGSPQGDTEAVLHLAIEQYEQIVRLEYHQH